LTNGGRRAKSSPGLAAEATAGARRKSTEDVVSESKVDDRLARLFPERGAGADHAPPVLAVPPLAIDSPAAAVEAAPLAPRAEPLIYADGPDAADLMGAAEATRPLAELCLAADVETPFTIGFVGPSGSGASFALRRWAENVEALAAAAARTPGGPFLAKVAVASIDAAGVSGDPACAIASAAFAALERGRDGVNYAALADEAANAGADPLRAAAAAAERHDELVRRLEAERAARDEVEAKRARLTDALLYETPGSRVDAFIRANRGTIESRLRRFDLAEGDPTVNFRHLVRDFDGAGPAARAGAAVRAIWGYRGQLGWLIAAVIAFALAFAVDEARAPQAGDGLRALASFLAPVADWLAAHQDWLVGVSKGLTAIGALALLVVLWRAFAFAGLLYRGQRLLGHDARERRRDLEASAARINQRVAALDAQAEAAARHAEAAAKRAGGAKHSERAPGPVFASGPEAPRHAARSFFVELGRLMGGGGAPDLAAPQRIVFAFDNLDALPPADAAHLLEAAHALLGPGCVAAVAFDPAALSRLDAPETARRRLEKLFPIVFNVATLAPADGGRLAARMIGSNAVARPLRLVDAAASAITQALTPAETALLAALAPLAGETPRAVKRFVNACRAARTSAAPRPAVALMLATRLGGDRAAATAMRQALAGPGPELHDPAGPPALVAATQAARAANDGLISLDDARAAWDAARRYSLPD
jgi:hypothetical protein